MGTPVTAFLKSSSDDALPENSSRIFHKKWSGAVLNLYVMIQWGCVESTEEMASET